MEAGGEAGDRSRARGWRGRREGLRAGRVLGPGAAQVPVVAAGFDQKGQRQLVQAGAATVGDVLAGGDGRAVGRVRPASRGAGGRERLADRAERDDAVGGQALQRADRVAVVAELGVIVVLDDDPAASAGPRDQLLAAVSGEHDAGGPLVGRGHQDGPGAGALERGDVDAVVVDRDRHGGEAGAAACPVVELPGPGSSKARVSTPLAASARSTSPRACAMPLQMTTWSAVAATARTRRR